MTFHNFLGSGPDRGQSPVEWGDFPSVRTSVPPLEGPRASQAGLRPSQAGLRAWLTGSEGYLAGSEAWLAGSEACLTSSEG